MYAIVKSGGKQYRAEKDTVLFVEKIEAPVDSTVDLEVIMSVKDSVATINGKTVKAKILEHGLGDKLDIFKYKAKKNYRRRMGHRQPYTKLQIIGF
ncbi:MAG: 50S ribosomal protein L21 [Firmicutes bacterium]|nr:50S ribosomal protein L21 [Bacillota bacterium]